MLNEEKIELMSSETYGEVGYFCDFAILYYSKGKEPQTNWR